MIEIKLEFGTGKEAREALMELLYGETKDFAIKGEKIAGNFEAPKTGTAPEEATAKKRRTKADIETDKGSTTVTPGNEPEGSVTNQTDIQEETKPAEETTSAVTAKMLQDKAVSVIRLGKKEEVTKLLEKFGAKSISQADKSPLKVEDYAAVMDELNKL